MMFFLRKTAGKVQFMIKLKSIEIDGNIGHISELEFKKKYTELKQKLKSTRDGTYVSIALYRFAQPLNEVEIIVLHKKE